MIRRLPRLGWLLLVWLALWEDLSLANLVSGSAVALAVMAAFPERSHDNLRIRPLAAARFVLTVAGQLAVASAVVAWEVVTPRNRLNQAVVAVPLEGASDVVTTLVANVITLTPGTLTIEVHRDPTVLYVHVMHLRDIEAVRADLRRLEDLAVAAVGLGSPGTQDRTPRGEG